MITPINDERTLFEWRRRTKSEPLPNDFYMKTWDQLHELRSRIHESCDAILERADKDKRDLSESEDVAFKYGLNALDCINENFEFRKKHDTREPIDYNHIPRPFHRAATVGDDGSRARETERTGAAESRTVRGMFYGREDATLDRGGFDNFREFVSVVCSGRTDSRLREARTHIEGIGSAGGFVVPIEFAAMLLDKSLESEIVRPRAELWPMQTKTREIPAWDGDDHTNALYGGWMMEWLGEDTAATIQTAKIRNMTMTAHKGALYTEASREVLQDAAEFQNRIVGGLVKAIGFYMDYSFFTGNGVSKPLGILNSPAALSVNRQTANQISFADLVNMYARIHGAFKSNAVWVMNHDVIPQLANVRDTGNNNLFITAQAGVAPNMPTTLFGCPILYTEKVPGLGSKGDVMLVDFSQYAVGMRQEIVVDVSNAPGWTRDVTSLRAIVRVDGQSLWNKPITPKHGANQLSHAVVLDIP